MGVVRVDPARLREVASRIRAGMSGLRSGAGGVLGVCGLTGGTTGIAWAGDPALAEAVGLFARLWGPVVAELTDDVGRVADALDLIAAAYRDAEVAIASSMTTPASARAP